MKKPEQIQSASRLSKERPECIQRPEHHPHFNQALRAKESEDTNAYILIIAFFILVTLPVWSYWLRQLATCFAGY